MIWIYFIYKWFRTCNFRTTVVHHKWSASEPLTLRAENFFKWTLFFMERNSNHSIRYLITSRYIFLKIFLPTVMLSFHKTYQTVFILEKNIKTNTSTKNENIREWIFQSKGSTSILWRAHFVILLAFFNLHLNFLNTVRILLSKFLQEKYLQLCAIPRTWLRGSQE
jgi:hypothetical protein